MKYVIRKGVFETNSSSTHSFTIERNKRKYEHHLQIVSAEEKIVWLLSMIAEAEEVYNYPCRQEMVDEMIEMDMDNIKEKLMKGEETLESLNVTSLEEYRKKLEKSYDNKGEVLQLKENIIAYYCKKNKITRQEADEIFKNKNCVPPENNDCRMNSKCRGKLGGEFSCARYFDEGALMDCRCGFEDYNAISYSFYLQKRRFKIEENFIKWFLSDKCTIIARENWW